MKAASHVGMFIHHVYFSNDLVFKLDKSRSLMKVHCHVLMVIQNNHFCSLALFWFVHHELF
jgi:hypothetical protein